METSPKNRSRSYRGHAIFSGTAYVDRRRIQAPRARLLTVLLTVPMPPAPPSRHLPDDLLIRPPNQRVGAAPSLVMAGAVKLSRCDAGREPQRQGRVEVETRLESEAGGTGASPVVHNRYTFASDSMVISTAGRFEGVASRGGRTFNHVPGFEAVSLSISVDAARHVVVRMRGSIASREVVLCARLFSKDGG